MKLHAQQVTWAHRAWAAGTILADERRLVSRAASAAGAESGTLVCRRSTGGSRSGPLGVVRILAFCQALLFLALFLLICAWAGATTVSTRSFNPEMSRSVYSPVTVRDPFGSGVAKSAGAPDGERIRAAVPSMLKLKGILYHAMHPAAIVNDQLVELNKSVAVQTEQGAVEIKALQITREVVLLEVGGQKVELRLGGGERE